MAAIKNCIFKGKAFYQNDTLFALPKQKIFPFLADLKDKPKQQSFLRSPHFPRAFSRPGSFAQRLQAFVWLRVVISAPKFGSHLYA